MYRYVEEEGKRSVKRIVHEKVKEHDNINEEIMNSEGSLYVRRTQRQE
jgi:hypothetical protein